MNEDRYDLVDYIIRPMYWDEYYSQMPEKIKQVVDGPPESVGSIGKNSKLGWFLLSKKGCKLLWSERSAQTKE